MLRATTSLYRNRSWNVLHKLHTPLIIVGYGNIGRGILPLLERHLEFPKTNLHILEPNFKPGVADGLVQRGFQNIHPLGLTFDNYESVLNGVFGASPGGDGADQSVRGIILNCSVDTSSVDLVKYAMKNKLLYVDTVVEPWKGFYSDPKLGNADRTNYMLRESMNEVKRAAGGKGSTCVSACGANPGMVSWFVKDALLQLAKDTGRSKISPPTTRKEWAALMQQLGVKGCHIAERDTQWTAKPKPPDTFWNTWSVEGFLAEGYQPAELGWGTHEKWFPPNGKRHTTGCKAAIYMEQPGADARVRTWCPTLGPQFGQLVTHNESISIADYYTVGEGDTPVYRPTVHYAYQPSPMALLSLHEVFGNGNVPQRTQQVLLENQLDGGFDELGVLLYGHSKNALWLGSTLSHEECVSLVDEQNATALQVTSAMLAATNWALLNPNRGVVEADDMDHQVCLDVQKPYLGKFWHKYTDWTPLDGILPGEGRWNFFEPPARTDRSDPWQFANVLV